VNIQLPLVDRTAVNVTRGRSLPRFHLLPGVPIAILVFMVGIAIFAPLLTPFDPVKADLRNFLQPPAFVGGLPDHFLGTDTFGRDVWSRLVFGARVSLSVALLSLTIATIVGGVVGLAAGYLGGWVDSALMRLVDVVLALPTVLVALAIAIALGPSYTNMILIIGLMIWPRTARLLRAETLLIKQHDFARYSRAVGVPGWLIVGRHILPNVMPTLLVAVTLEVGNVILLEATLSFLGAGIPAPQPSWGVMVSDGRALIGTGWWISLFPGIAILLTVLSCNMLGDWLRDHFDPKFREV